jgi:ElaB/YqjD/DUF883 family membrane-anchored ribosome-binding protein
MAMAARSDGSDFEQEVQAQIKALREQLDDLVAKAGPAATAAVRDVGRAAQDQMDTVCAQVRTQPIATMMIAAAGAAVGFILARITR